MGALLGLAEPFADDVFPLRSEIIKPFDFFLLFLKDMCACIVVTFPVRPGRGNMDS